LANEEHLVAGYLGQIEARVLKNILISKGIITTEEYITTLKDTLENDFKDIPVIQRAMEKSEELKPK
jgi:hypothetical protein